jgi:hypothetical protein
MSTMATSILQTEERSALLRRKRASPCGFETDSPPILRRLLLAQSWSVASFTRAMVHYVGEHADYAEIFVYTSGLVIAKGRGAELFLSAVVEWSGGAL